MWGAVADTYGRRPTLMLGLIGTAMAAILFGCAPNFGVALFARFAWGLLNGNIGIAKTYMGEISNNKNSAKGMAIFGTVGGLGRTVGPVIGGFLSQPSEHYELFKGGFFEKYPFALPSVIIVILCSVALMTAFVELAETLPSPKPLTGLCMCGTADSTGSGSEANICSIEMSSGPSEGSKHKEFKYDNLSTEDDGRSCVSDLEGGAALEKMIEAECGGCCVSSVNSMTDGSLIREATDSCDDKDEYEDLDRVVREDDDTVSGKMSSILRIFWVHSIFYATTLYGLIAFVHMIIAEIFPLWLVIPVEDGGFGFNAHKIGLTIMVSGPVTIFTQLVVYPWLVKWLNVLTLLRIGLIGFTIVIGVTPSITAVKYPDDSISNVLMTMSYSLFSVFIGWSYVCVFVLVNNSCLAKERATVNALGQSCASLARLVGPYLGGNIFALTASGEMHWPINYSLCFYLVAIASVYVYFHSKKLPESIVNKKVEVENK